MASPTPARTDVVAALRACRLWRGASDAAVEHLADRARVRRLARGEILFEEGASTTELAIVIAGTAAIYHLGANGRKLIFEKAGSGEPIGAIAALAGARTPAYVEAATPLFIASLPVEAVFDLLIEEPDVTRTLVADLARRVVDVTNVVQSFTLDVPQRLARYLFQRSLAAGRAMPDGLHVPLDMAKAELASALGTVPETLSRAFARLRDDGIIETSGRIIVVHDVGALARRGEGFEEG